MAARVIKNKNTTIRIELKTLEKLINPKKAVNKATSIAIGDATKQEIMDLVAVGQSPVKGKGRFKAYAAQRKGSGYPETGRIRERYPDKKTRPVNLYLDGSYLEAITEFKTIPGGVLFGLLNQSDESDEFNKTLFKVHNEGERPDIPQRKVIPTGKDTFSVGIIRRIKSIYLKRIKDIIKRGD